MEMYHIVTLLMLAPVEYRYVIHRIYAEKSAGVLTLKCAKEF
jgi:hypothetical protein